MTKNIQRMGSAAPLYHGSGIISLVGIGSCLKEATQQSLALVNRVQKQD